VTAVEIRFARPDEAALAVPIWREVAQWLSDRNMALWPPSMFTLEMGLVHAEAGELVLGFDGETACASMLLQGADPVVWPEKVGEAALYLHKLAVRRASAGSGWAERMIMWAAARAEDARMPLRLDCAPRPALMGLYEGCGFVGVDGGPVLRDGFMVMRYERG
jgi:GNAT superfamily N-acetyltransferase